MNSSAAEVRAFYGVVGLILLIPLVVGLVGAFGGLEGMALLFGVDRQILISTSLRNSLRAICFMFFALVPLVIWTLAALPERAGAFRITFGCAFLAGFARLTGFLVEGYPGVVAVVFMTMELALMPVVLLWHARLVRLLTQPSQGESKVSLPPGQQAIGFFPRRYGIAFWEPRPPIAEPALIRVAGAVARQLEVPVSRLAELQRRDLVADFHCVTGWTTPGLHWGGVSFRTFYESVIVPEAGPEPGVSHIRFEGADGFRAVLALDDVFDEDVLLADQLGGTALDSDRGAPVRLLSSKHYGGKLPKHLCCIELHTRAPAEGYRTGILRRFLKWLVTPHPRGHVAEEERHRYLPGWAVRGIYWMLFRSWAWLYRRRNRP